MSERNIYRYEGKSATVTWDQRLCIHVGECGRARGDLFVDGRKPWCAPDESDPEEAARVIARCPSGALALLDADGTLVAEDAPAENTVRVSNDGPLYFAGDLAVDGVADDMPSAGRRVALCRCGQSKNKPFCDNSHRDAGFKDAGAVGETGKPLEERGGELAVNPIPDGPLEVAGNLTMHAGTGRAAWEGRKVYLCRCGASANKPFCDGSHKRIGFTSD